MLDHKTQHIPEPAPLLAVESAAPDAGSPPSFRQRRPNRRPWVVATGTPGSLSRKAAFYLRLFDYNQASKFDSQEMILAKVVCNLRYYYQQDAEQTVELVRSHFNKVAGYDWSPVGIRLTWELVEGFTPSLGLSDDRAVAMQKAAELEIEVQDLIAFTRPGGRVPVDTLYSVFRSWNPDLEVSVHAFGRAVKSVTGIGSASSKGIRYYSGVHLPSDGEWLVDSPSEAPKLKAA